VRNRPLTATKNCVGPTAPIESGGNAPVSVSVAPVKVVDKVCATLATAPPRAIFVLLGSGGDVGFCGRRLRSGRRSGRMRTPRGSAIVACRAINSPVVARIPKAPVAAMPICAPASPVVCPVLVPGATNIQTAHSAANARLRIATTSRTEATKERSTYCPGTLQHTASAWNMLPAIPPPELLKNTQLALFGESFCRYTFAPGAALVEHPPPVRA